MKPYFIGIISLILLSENCKAQIQIKSTEEKTIKIGTVKRLWVLAAELSYTVSKDDTAYFLMYKNARFETITDYQGITFENTDNTLQNLYLLLKNSFSKENRDNKDYNIKFTLGKTDVTLSWLTNNKSYLEIWTSEGYFYLNEKEVDKLFGKS